MNKKNDDTDLDGISDWTTSAQILDLLNALHSMNRNAAMLKLKTLDKVSAIQLLRPFLKDPNPEKRALAVEALMNIDTRQSLELVLPFLEDANSEVRWTICYWLCEDGDSRVVDALIKTLQEDNDVNVRSQAVIALGASRNSKAKDVLTWAKEHDFEVDYHGHSVSHAARIALQNLNDGI